MQHIHNYEKYIYAIDIFDIPTQTDIMCATIGIQGSSWNLFHKNYVNLELQ